MPGTYVPGRYSYELVEVVSYDRLILVAVKAFIEALHPASYLRTLRAPKQRALLPLFGYDSILLFTKHTPESREIQRHSRFTPPTMDRSGEGGEEPAL